MGKTSLHVCEKIWEEVFIHVKRFAQEIKTVYQHPLIVCILGMYRHEYLTQEKILMIIMKYATSLWIILRNIVAKIPIGFFHNIFRFNTILYSKLFYVQFHFDQCVTSAIRNNSEEMSLHASKLPKWQGMTAQFRVGISVQLPSFLQ